MCLGLASAYAERAIGPAALSIEHAVTEPTLESVVETTLLEGCIGELVAAAEAREVARAARDPLIRRILSEIADDESRHAVLAWQFLQWALGRSGLALVRRIGLLVSAELARAVEIASARNPDVAAADTALAIGVPPESFRAWLRTDVIAKVVVPCLDALATQACSSRDEPLAVV